MSELRGIGDYKIDLSDRIGRGAYGDVYNGEDQNGKNIAAKIVQYKKKNSIQEKSFKVGITELEIFRKLQGHNNILKLLYYFDDGRSHWLIMELGDLGDLQDYLRQNGDISRAAKIKIMYQCASAVSFMHSFTPPVVHRDIKATNVLMVRQGNQDVAKLTDFGLGKIYQPSQSHIHLTMTSEVGTYSYMAPEFYMAKNPEDLKYHPSVDTFALGLLYHVLLFYSKANNSLEPLSETARRTNIFIHFGLEMVHTVRNNEPMPVLYTSRFETDSVVEQLQEVIAGMILYEEKQRTKPAVVKDKLMDIHRTLLWEENTNLRKLNDLQTSRLSDLTDKLQCKETELNEKQDAENQFLHFQQNKEEQLQKKENLVLSQKAELAEKTTSLNSLERGLVQKQDRVMQLEAELKSIKKTHKANELSPGPQYMNECLQTLNDTKVREVRPKSTAVERNIDGTPHYTYQLQEDGYLMVTAIDLGIAYSTYAFSFTYSPEQITMNKNWGSSTGYEMYETPTSVLMKSDGSFVAFGHEAETKYCKIEDDTNEFEIYRHFMMVLQKEKNISRDSIVKSERGRKCHAMDVFVMALKYLKDHLLKSLNQQLASPLSNDMIRWALTFPARLADGAKAKQFIRMAAMKAGLISNKDSTQLLIAVEPEVALALCRSIDYIQNGDLTELPFEQYTKYLVINAGDDIIDITACEIVSQDAVRVLYTDSELCGGNGVDTEFINTLNYLLGEKFIDSFINRYPPKWIAMMNSFKKAKQNIDPNNEITEIYIQVSWALAVHCMEITGKDFETLFQEHRDKGISFQDGNIVFNHDASIALFKKVTDQTKLRISQLLRNDQLKDIAYVLLLGGFGGSKVLKEAIQEVLPWHISVVMPIDHEHAMLKGAVLLGHSKNKG